MTSNRIARLLVEVVAAGALIVAIFVWPHTRLGWAIQIISAVVVALCLVVLRKWHSA